MDTKAWGGHSAEVYGSCLVTHGELQDPNIRRRKFWSGSKVSPLYGHKHGRYCGGRRRRLWGATGPPHPYSPSRNRRRARLTCWIDRPTNVTKKTTHEILAHEWKMVRKLEEGKHGRGIIGAQHGAIQDVFLTKVSIDTSTFPPPYIWFLEMVTIN